MTGWAGLQAELDDIASRQIFFVGGAPRSGTTWLQYMLDAHPDVICRGEGHFMKELAEPLTTMMAGRRTFLERKNSQVFHELLPYPPPDDRDTAFLIRTAILLALRRQANGAAFLAIGEKTPENTFFFPALKHMFPQAKFIGIARDPRETMTSAWYFFRRPSERESADRAAKLAFIRSAIEPIARGFRMMLDFRDAYPGDTALVTYDSLLRGAECGLVQLCRFLGVGDDPAIIAGCVAGTRFEAMSGGRPSGMEDRTSFFRKGAVNDWDATLTPQMNDLILRELGWVFPAFGWSTD